MSISFPPQGFPPVTTQPNLRSQSKPIARRSRQAQPVRFAGAGDVVSAFIGLIDRNRAAELFSSDFLGMLMPRTAVAAKYRGVDDARETLIREGAGLVCVALLSGFGNQAMLRLFGNGVNFSNPHGTPAKAWIGAKNLRVLSQMYDQALDSAGNVAEAREAFIKRVLSGLEADDRALSLEGRLASLRNLAKDPTATENILGQMARELYGDSVGPEHQRKWQTLLQKGDMTQLRQELLGAGWGKLSKSARKDLTTWFAQKSPGDTHVKGTVAFDRLAKQRVRELASALPEQQKEQAFREFRLSAALAHLHDVEPKFAQSVDEFALNHGLTSVVHLKDSTGKTLLSGQSRKTLLGELKAFLEHYVDRAAYQAEQAAKAKTLDWSAQQRLIRETLFAAPSKGLRGLLPHLEDGLVTATLKGKRVYTWVPILIAISANGIATFLNNYLTRRKYGGRVFFPGEEAFAHGRPQPQPVRGRLA